MGAGGGCLPRGCVNLGVCSGGGVCPGRGLPAEGVSAHGVSVQGVCVCLGGCLPRGCVCPEGLSATPPTSVDRQMPVKILPYPKLRLRVVINNINCCHSLWYPIEDPGQQSHDLVYKTGKEEDARHDLKFHVCFTLLDPRYATGISLQREFGMGQHGTGNGKHRSVSAFAVFLF